MGTPIAVDRHGNSLTELAVATTAQLEEAAASTPCPLVLAVVVAETSGNVLFGLNRWRREYELPGGMVDDGETFPEAVTRELEEETTLRVEPLDLVGYVRFTLTNPDREELAAIYLGRVTDARPHATYELQHLLWRQPLTATDADISALDDAIAAWAIEVSRQP